MTLSLRRLALSLVTGVIFVYWSELAFWARPSPGTSLTGMIPTTLVYAVAGYLFLAVVSAFKARQAPAVFLAGALFGWFVEGVFVQTMVEDLPLSISFTGLAWHAAITVMVGWWLIPRWLGEARTYRLAALSSVIGLAYGWWAMTWWVETPPPTPVFSFMGYAFLTTAVLIGAYALASRLHLEPFSPSRLEWGLVSALVILYFSFVTIPAAPVSLIVLPPLFGLVILALRRLRGRSPDASPRRVPGRARPFAALLLIPVAASAVYALGSAAGLRLPTGMVVYLVMTPAGFVLLGWALWRAFARRTHRPAAEPAGGG